MSKHETPMIERYWRRVGGDTAEFAVESLRRWWRTMGAQEYPQAQRLLITADCGGSNGYRTRAWKLSLQHLANELALEITVCHFPPGTSKAAPMNTPPRGAAPGVGTRSAGPGTAGTGRTQAAADRRGCGRRRRGAAPRSSRSPPGSARFEASLRSPDPLLALAWAQAPVFYRRLREARPAAW